METKMIGGKIADARKKVNMTQAQLADHLFISAQAVGKWERGESFPDIITFNRLAKLLGVDLNYFSADFQSVAVPLAPAESIVQPLAGLPLAKPAKKPLWDMSDGNWVGADFSGLMNLHEKFSSSNLQKCLFAGSDLSGLLLRGNHVEGCDFSGSNLANSRLQNSHLTNNLFRDCSLRDTQLTGSYFKNCDFSGSDFSGAVIQSSGFQKALLENAVFSRTSFHASHFSDMVFNGTLEDCFFDNCGFSKVTFQHSTLLNTCFKGRSLKRVQFIGCEADRLTYEFLKHGKADLSGITLVEMREKV